MTGERQEATTYDDIRLDHRQRYEWASARVGEWGPGLDLFCGVGYGTWKLAVDGHKRVILGIDGSQEAIDVANTHYKVDNNRFGCWRWEQNEPRITEASFIVSLESIEHVPDPIRFFNFLARALRPGGVIVYSSPNSNILPKLPGTFPHHSMHFPHETILSLGNATYDDCQLEVIDWAGQDVYVLENSRPVRESKFPTVMSKVEGQFTLVAARRKLTT